jgi:DNA polymerase-3 subunit beta
MQVRVERDVFVEALGPVQGVVEAKKSLPVLSHVLLEATPEGVWLFGTDLDVGVRKQVEAEVVRPGSVALSAKKLYEVARELPSAPVDLQMDADLQIAISCQRSSFRMKGLPREDFPAMPEMKGDGEVTLDGALFRAMLRKTLFAVSSDQTRYALTGVLFQVQAAEVVMVATDGHRLALVRTPKPAAAGSALIDALVPKKAMVEAVKIAKDDADPVQLSLAENHLVLKQQSTVLSARLIDGQFPNYEQVIPTTGTPGISVNREALHGALRRTSAIMGDRVTPTEFHFQPGRVLISCVNIDLGEAHEEVEAVVAGEGVKVGFNARYVMEFLNAVDAETVTVQIGDPLSPAVFRPEGDGTCSCVIMPMRI